MCVLCNTSTLMICFKFLYAKVLSDKDLWNVLK